MAVDGKPCKSINTACKMLVRAAHGPVHGVIVKFVVEVTIVNERENTVGALLGEGLLPMLKLVVGDEVGDAAADIEGIAVEVAPRSAAAIASAVAS